MAGLTLLQEAGASTQIATDSDLDALSATIVDNQRRIIALEEALGNVESWDWKQIGTNYTCPDAPVQKLYPTANITITLPSHAIGRKVQILLSDRVVNVKTLSGVILTRGGGQVSNMDIKNKGEYEFVSDGVNWIDQSNASRVESGSVEYRDATGSLVAGGKKYMLNASGNFYLPNPTGLARGDMVVFEATRAAIPIVNTHASTTKINTSRGEATAINVNLSGEEVRLIWNTFEWVL